MKTQTCCFTGHRDIPASEHAAIQARLESEIVTLIHQGVKFFGAGGALGFDTMAAQTVLALKQNFPHIRLILVLPCKEQTKLWRDADKKTYNQILNNADKVVYTSERYHSCCMQERNRHLADNSGFCICYVTKSTGGSAYTAECARRRGVKIINCAIPPAVIYKG